MRARWLKSTIDNESARRLAEQAIANPALVEEQRQIEMELARSRNQFIQEDQLKREKAEVAAARIESNPNDYSNEHDLSLDPDQF